MPSRFHRAPRIIFTARGPDLAAHLGGNRPAASNSAGLFTVSVVRRTIWTQNLLSGEYCYDLVGVSKIF
jgi:hypothetical protein